MLTVTYRLARRIVILVLGISVILVGVAMIVLPGPAVVVIPAGLAILATEFVWAAKLLKKVKQQVVLFKDKIIVKDEDDSESKLHDRNIEQDDRHIK